MKIADLEEQCYQDARLKLLDILQLHYRETQRVTEIFSQFDQIIRGVFQQRVNDFIKEDRREKEYEAILKELNFYQKLSMQLPTLVFFPMFEVGTQNAKDEIQRRIKKLLEQVFNKFEAQLIARSQDICDKYNQVCKNLDKVLKSALDVVDMDRYKNNLLLEIAGL